MADWFRADPTKLLRGMGGLTDDAQLVYYKALCLIYENDGRISVKQLAREFPNWRAKRLDRAVSELLDMDKLGDIRSISENVCSGDFTIRGSGGPPPYISNKTSHTPGGTRT